MVKDIRAVEITEINHSFVFVERVAFSDRE